MSMALSKNIEEKSLSWNSETLITNTDDWEIVGGNASFGTSIVLYPDSEIKLAKDFTEKNYKANYLKLLNHLTCEDKSLSTDNTHNVCVIYEVVYLVENNGTTEEQSVIYEFYPKYDFESNFKKDYTIVGALNSNIKSIEVSIINSESVAVEITESALYLSYVVDEGTVSNIVHNTIQNYVPTSNRYSCIDVLDEDPDPATVPNGINNNYCYMWILRSSL